MMEDIELTESLPPPQPMSNISLPTSTKCVWSIDDKRRIITGDFRGVKSVSDSDIKFLLSMFERPDVVVICKGLAKRTKIGGGDYDYFLKQMRESNSFQGDKLVKLAEGTVKKTTNNDGRWEPTKECPTIDAFLRYHEQCKNGKEKKKLVSSVFLFFALLFQHDFTNIIFNSISSIMKYHKI